MGLVSRPHGLGIPIVILLGTAIEAGRESPFILAGSRQSHPGILLEDRALELQEVWAENIRGEVGKSHEYTESGSLGIPLWFQFHSDLVCRVDCDIDFLWGNFPHCGWLDPLWGPLVEISTDQTAAEGNIVGGPASIVIVQVLAGNRNGGLTR